MKLSEKSIDRKIDLSKDDEPEEIYNYCGLPTMMNNSGFTCQMIWTSDLLHRS